jgi:WD40 repeat protein
MRKLLPLLMLLWGGLSSHAQDTLRMSWLTDYPNIYQLGFHPAGTLLAVSSYAYDVDDQLRSTIQLLEVNSGTVLGALQSPTDERLMSFAFSADGQFLYSGAESGQIAMWNLQDLQMVNQVPAHDGAPDLALSPDGKFLVSADTSGVIIWDAAAFSPLLILPPMSSEEARLMGILISPDSRTLATRYSSGIIQFISLTSGETVGLIDPSYGVEAYTAAYTPDGNIALGYETLELWQVGATDQDAIVTADGAIYEVTFTPSRAALVDASGALTLWDYPTWQPLGTIAEGISTSWDLVFSPDGTAVAVAHDAGNVSLYAVQ